ncbi:RNA polymerase sigma factor RpoD [uncultured archaeon]|nr:RNA polymerase sigma factor RpoD [uncultured archaeon]
MAYGNYEESLSSYLNEIGKIEILSRGEEEELCMRMEKGDEKAREKLIESSLRFVVTVAKKYCKCGVPFMDLISEGNIGLIKATEKYNYKRGNRFLTYANHWIKQSIRRALGSSKAIRIPPNLSTKLVQAERLALEGLSTEEISKEINIPAKSIEYARFMSEVTSLDCPVFEDEEEKTIKDSISYVEDNNSKIERDVLDSIISERLDKKNADIIRLRFGFGGIAYTLEEVGMKYNLSKERIRQIEKKALIKLRIHCKELAN